tara:strand:- start:165 stop:374 length:210 start_codon:yes stop_codon:yes gene_type:complete
MSRPTLDELGISRDTVIISVEGGVIQEIFNDSNGVEIFNWDEIKEDEELDEDQEYQRLQDILYALENEI